MLSIVIPTFNEENYLPKLLDSIKKQSFKDYEIIVADADSLDRTKEIAQRYGCKITRGGLPAKGRNNGAKIAQGNLLLFLDADTILSDNFLEKALSEFEKRKLQIASFFLRAQEKDRFFDFLLNFFYNLPIFLMEKTLAHGAMAILIERELFNNLGGFDEEIKLAEDHDLMRRAKKIAKYGIIKPTKIFISNRRFKKDGWLKTCFKYLLCEIHMIFLGPVKSDIFKYRFGYNRLEDLQEKKDGL